MIRTTATRIKMKLTMKRLLLLHQQVMKMFIKGRIPISKRHRKQITLRDIGTDETDEDLSWPKFAEVNHCITRKKWSNSIKDIETDREFHTESNHY